MAVKFYLDARANKHNEYPIRASFSIKNQKMATSIGISVSNEVWSNGKVKSKKYTNSKGLSGLEINSTISKIVSHFGQYELDLDKRPTTDDIKQELQKALKGPKDGEEKPVAKAKTIYDDLKEFINEQSIACQWAHATLQCWTTFTHHLESFGKRLVYADFNETGINKFVRHLRIQRNLEEKTVQKQFNNLKWFLNWAIRKGYCKEEYINKYRPKFKVLEKPVIFLTKEELLKLYTYEIPKNGTKVKLVKADGEEYEKTVQEAGALAKTRDLFCFCAFTSLRYSDMASLKRIDVDGDKIYITTKKTNDRLPIDLSKNAKAILEKYKDEQFPLGLALPVISNQKMNHYLKDLGELCGFTTPITIVCYRAGQRVEETYPKYSLIGTHAARRTFICFALSNGVAPQVVMKWTGHSDYKAMRPYIDIAEKTKADAMKKIDDAWGM